MNVKSPPSKEKPIKYLLPYLARYRSKIVFSLLTMLVASLLAIPGPFLIKRIIDDILPSKNFHQVLFVLTIILGIHALKFLFSVLSVFLFARFNQDVITQIKIDIIGGLINSPLAFFDQHQTGYLMSRLKDIDSLSYFFSDSLGRSSIRFLELIFCLVMLFYLYWKLALIACLVLPAFFWITRYVSGRLKNICYNVMETDAVLFQKIQDTLSGIEAVKLFGGENKETGLINGQLLNYREGIVKRNIHIQIISEVYTILGSIVALVVLGICSRMIIRNQFSIGGYLAFSMYLSRLFEPIWLIAQLGTQYQQSIVALKRTIDLVKMTFPEGDHLGFPLEKITERIEFRNVSFSYGQKPVLKNLDLVCQKSEKILITGPNGAGKSTLLKLLLGLYKAQDGQILIDDRPLDVYSVKSLRNRIGILSQNPYLFNDSIRNNVLYSARGATEAELQEALARSGVHDFVKNLPNKEETLVGETGKCLSGGERQKISIARVLLKDADVLILDEATTHLDKRSRAELVRLVKNHYLDKFVIVVSHGIFNADDFDKVYDLVDGRLVRMFVNRPVLKNSSVYPLSPRKDP